MASEIQVDIPESSDAGASNLSSLSQKLKSLSVLSPDRCIYRVPKRFRNANPTIYTPKMISIGPLHHGEEHLKQMEEHKQRYLQHFIKHYKLNVDNLLEFMRAKEIQLRNCYAETITFTSQELLEVVLVDAAFTIMFFLRRYDFVPKTDDDPIYGKPWLSKDIEDDMILLENQLPFFIVVDILKHANTQDKEQQAVLDFQVCTEKFIRYYVCHDEKKSEIFKCDNVQHFVHMMLICHQPLQKPQTSDRLKDTFLPSIGDLRDAGVKFEVSKSKTLTDIHFKNGILKIPRLKIRERTERFLRNIVAFEQCHDIKTHFSDYALLIGSLVTSTKDANLLAKNKVIDCAGADPAEVFSVIKNITEGVNFDYKDFYYTELYKELNRYSNIKWNKWLASLRHTHFDNPWTIISVIAAVILLILTLLQTIFSRMSIN